jgi:hypothetical protein
LGSKSQFNNFSPRGKSRPDTAPWLSVKQADDGEPRECQRRA